MLISHVKTLQISVFKTRIQLNYILWQLLYLQIIIWLWYVMCQLIRNCYGCFDVFFALRVRSQFCMINRATWWGGIFKTSWNVHLVFALILSGQYLVRFQREEWKDKLQGVEYLYNRSHSIQTRDAATIFRLDIFDFVNMCIWYVFTQ